MKSLPESAASAWFAAAGSIAGFFWPKCFGTEIPMPGLHGLSAPNVGGPLLFAALAIAILLSVPAFRSKERLLISAGVAMSLFVMIAFYVTPVYAGAYLLVTRGCIKDARA
jgi:hypothetical protein